MENGRRSFFPAQATRWQHGVGHCLLAALLLIAACGKVHGADPGNSNNDNSTAQCTTLGERRCVGNALQVCQDGTWTTEQVCDPAGVPCDPVYGCEDSACRQAKLNRSYLGCEYWPTPVMNSALDSVFANNFGVAVYNPSSDVVTVELYRGSQPVAERTLAASTLHTFALELFTGLVKPWGRQSVLVEDAAYYLTSTGPVTVYQFNPLDYLIDNTTSLSNDASLLLPRHALSTSYIVMSRPTWGSEKLGSGFSYYSGYVTIIGTQNETRVNIAFSAKTQEGLGVPEFGPGEQYELVLNAGEAMQFLSRRPGAEGCPGTVTQDDCRGTEEYPNACTYCALGAEWDLTGTVIESSFPVAVFSGHDCTYVPYDYPACDHLEEQLLPLNTWGREYLVTRTAPQSDAADPAVEPNIVRVLSGAPGNTIIFDPPQPEVGGLIILDRGQWREFATFDDFIVRADHAVLIGQFTVGQTYYSIDQTSNGDPSFSTVVPTDQYRNAYSFVAPSTFPVNYVNVIKEVGPNTATVLMDGAAIPENEFSLGIGETTYGVARVAISGGPHTVTAPEAFGIQVYGFAPFASYMYPGGLNLRVINPVE